MSTTEKNDAWDKQIIADQKRLGGDEFMRRLGRPALTYTAFRAAYTRYFNGAPQSLRDLNEAWRWYKAGETRFCAGVKFLLSHHKGEIK